MWCRLDIQHSWLRNVYRILKGEAAGLVIIIKKSTFYEGLKKHLSIYGRKERLFLLHVVPDCFGVHIAFYSVDTETCFSSVKDREVKLDTRPNLNIKSLKWVDPSTASWSERINLTLEEFIIADVIGNLLSSLGPFLFYLVTHFISLLLYNVK